MVERSREKTIAVIGAGIAGITAAHALSKRYSVTLYEKSNQLGGHTNTRVIEGPVDRGVMIDTGFIVCNARNYPNFYRFLAEHKVRLRNSDMSFGFYSEKSGLQYVGPALREFIKVPGNFLRRDFRSMLRERYRFNRQVLKDLRASALEAMSLGEYLARLKVSSFFIENYLVPLVASIWSSPDAAIADFPAATFARFFDNHGMLELHRRPQWQTVVGGSHSYIEAFKKNFEGRIVTTSNITNVVRTASTVTLQFADGRAQQFDKLVLATHADEALQLLGDADAQERGLLGAWRYSKNHAVLHTDASTLPPRRELWASWNYRSHGDRSCHAPVSITYYMNRLQGLRTQRDYFVTLNPDREIAKSSVIYETDYTHPLYSGSSVATQRQLTERNGTRNTFFCGAYLGYGFHEDGVNSALNAARRLEELQ